MRDPNKYGLREWTYENAQEEIITIYEVAARLVINANGVFINFQGWRSLEDFANSAPSISRWNKSLTANIEQLKTDYAQLYDLMISGAAAFLDFSLDDYEINALTIDVLNLSVQAQAQHRTKLNRFITDATASDAEFELLKEQHPEIVVGFFGFVWEYAKATDGELKKFKPIA